MQQILISLKRNISLGASNAVTDLHITAGKGAIKGPAWLMLFTLTFNLWIVWLLSSDIFCPAIMTAKVISDENMMKQQFIFPPPPPLSLSFPLSLSINLCSLSLPPCLSVSLFWHRVVEQWGTAEF